MTHSFQLLYPPPGTPAAGLVQGRARWGFEGVADLLSVEFVRREAGVAFTANFEWRQVPPTATYESWYARRAQPMGGAFTDGYHAAAGFLRDLVSRRLRAGDDLPTALREASPRAAAVATANRPYGSPGYMALRDGGLGVRLTVESQTPGLRWAVLRLR